jgi:hypothetical protein
MPTNLTGSAINVTFGQLMHVNGGPEATEKTLYSGTGVATAVKIGTVSASVGNVRFGGNTIASTNTNGNINLTPNGTGLVNITNVAFANQAAARTALALGTVATQNADAVAITGGTISNVVFTGSFVGITLIEATTLATSAAAAGVNLTGNTLGADGTDTNISINITPKGTGAVNITNVNIVSGAVPYNTITGRAYASFYDADTADQVGSTTDRTAVQFATASVVGIGITVASNSRITFAETGTYRINLSLQFGNSSTTDRYIDVWFAKNGVNLDSTNGRIAVPRLADGGIYLLAYEIFVEVTAGQYIEAYWHTENVSVTLAYRAAVVANPGVTPAIPATPPAIVVVERIE